MIRLLGMLFGSVVAVAALILLVGVPRLAEVDDGEPVDIRLPLPVEPVAESAAEAQEIVETPQQVVPQTSDPIPAVVPDAVAPAEPVAEGPADTDTLEALTAGFVEQAQPEEIHWYAFWSPFRSRIAAKGFVEQLQRVTGLDYRVVNVKPGVYEVAFAYTSDDEIPTSLSQISAATGLEMPES